MSQTHRQPSMFSRSNGIITANAIFCALLLLTAIMGQTKAGMFAGVAIWIGSLATGIVLLRQTVGDQRFKRSLLITLSICSGVMGLAWFVAALTGSVITVV